MADCINCGLCCFIPTGKNGEMVACPNLTWIGKRSFCKVYKNRLGKVIGTVGGKVYRCSMYNSVSSEITDCSINIPGSSKPRRKVTLTGKYTAKEEWV